MGCLRKRAARETVAFFSILLMVQFEVMLVSFNSFSDPDFFQIAHNVSGRGFMFHLVAP